MQSVYTLSSSCPPVGLAVPEPAHQIPYITHYYSITNERVDIVLSRGHELSVSIIIDH